MANLNSVKHVNVVDAKSDEFNEDPLVGFHFAIDIGGEIQGYFTECSGLGSETEIIEHKMIGDNGVEVTKKIPGRLKWEDITLKRGITSNLDIWEWRKMVEDGDVEGARRNGSIIMFNQELKQVASWSFERGWPSKVTGPQPKADSNEVGMEEVVITHEYISRDSKIKKAGAAFIGAATVGGGAQSAG